MSRDRNRRPGRPLIRVCAYCDAVRTVWPDGTERWARPKLRTWSDDTLSHGICPRCFEEVVAGLTGKHRRRETAEHVGIGR